VAGTCECGNEISSFLNLLHGVSKEVIKYVAVYLVLLYLDAVTSYCHSGIFSNLA
jgi:hypothetical protein